jgi:hypothetical protein
MLNVDVGERKTQVAKLDLNVDWWNKQPTKLKKIVRLGLQPNAPLPSFVPAPRLRQHSDGDVQIATGLLREYKALGAVEVVLASETRLVANWSLAPKGSGGHRLIVDLRPLNEYLLPKHFTASGIRELLPSLRRGQWAARLDLSNAYLHVRLSAHLAKYCATSVGGVVYKFTKLPFGLSLAPRTFTSLMEYLNGMMHAEGVRSWVFIDDIIIVGADPAVVQRGVQKWLALLDNAGFTVNHGKSAIEPSQVVTWLGFDLNFEQGKVCITKSKQHKLINMLKDVAEWTTTSARSAAKVLGGLRSQLLAVPQLRLVASILTKLTAQAGKSGWDYIKQLTKYEMGTLKKECIETIAMLQKSEGVFFPNDLKYELTLSTDASDKGWGAAVQDRQDLEVLPSTGDFFDRTEAEQHINTKELKAVLLGLKSYVAKWPPHREGPHQAIRINTDSSVVYWQLVKWRARQPHHRALLQKIWKFVEQHKLVILPNWLPSEENVLADMESRKKYDSSDYTLRMKYFEEIITFHQLAPEVDLFSTKRSRRCKKFISFKPQPGAHQVDALKADLSLYKVGWANPPWTLIHQFLNKLKQFPNLKVICVAPHWVSRGWWPLFTAMAGTSLTVWDRGDKLFKNCLNELMPVPRWSLVSAVLWSGNLPFEERPPPSPPCTSSRWSSR